MNFAEYAAVAPEEIPEAKLLPIGSYEWKIIRAPETKPSANGDWTLINFLCRVVRPIDDFESPEELEDFGDPAGEVRTLMFMFPEARRDDEDEKGLQRRKDQAMRQIMRFLTVDLGLEPAPVAELLSASVNQTFLGMIEHEADRRDPDVIRDRLRRTAPLA